MSIKCSMISNTALQYHFRVSVQVLVWDLNSWLPGQLRNFLWTQP